MINVLRQRLRHLLNRQNVIYQTSLNRAFRHIPVLCRLGGLCHGHATGRLDGLEANRTVVVSAGKDDTDRPFLQFFRERRE